MCGRERCVGEPLYIEFRTCSQILPARHFSLTLPLDTNCKTLIFTLTQKIEWSNI